MQIIQKRRPAFRTTQYGSSLTIGSLLAGCQSYLVAILTNCK